MTSLSRNFKQLLKKVSYVYICINDRVGVSVLSRCVCYDPRTLCLAFVDYYNFVIMSLQFRMLIHVS